jgi:hypothetical protein
MVSWVFRLSSVTKHSLLCRNCWFEFHVVAEMTPVKLRKVYEQMIEYYERNMGSGWVDAVRAKYPHVAMVRPKMVPQVARALPEVVVEPIDVTKQRDQVLDHSKRT